MCVLEIRFNLFVANRHQTLLCAVFTYVMLPNDIATASFLTPEERELGIARQAGVEHGTGNKERHEKFSLAEVRRAFLYPLTWLTAGAYFGLLSAIYSFGLFVSFLGLK